MNRIRHALAAATALFFAHHASAADMPGPAPIMRAPSAILTSSWAGLYVGGHAGYAWANGQYTVNNLVVERFTFDPAGFIGGGQIGLQAQWGHWVFGIEGSYSWAELAQSRTSALVAGTSSAADLRHIGTITGKIGYAVDRWLVYGKGGIAYGRFHTQVTAPGLFFDNRTWEPGYTLGLGVDYMLLPNWIVGAEFNYYNFSFNRTFAPVAGIANSITNSDVDVLAITLRLNYLFNMRW
jgi:outer membrane immunogenic protein